MAVGFKPYIVSGRYLQVEKHAAMNIPIGDAQTRFKMSARGEPGAMKQHNPWGKPLYVAIDRGASIAANREAFGSSSNTLGSKTVNLIDMARHGFMRAIGR